MGFPPFSPLSNIARPVPTLALTPSCFPHNSYQLTTCSCLFLLPLQSSSPGLVGSRLNSSCHILYISLLYFRLFISKHMCLPISLPQNFRNSFLTAPSIFYRISNKLLLTSPRPPEAICMVEPFPFSRNDRVGPRKKVGWQLPNISCKSSQMLLA